MIDSACCAIDLVRNELFTLFKSIGLLDDLLEVGGARQVLISREISLRHKELKIVRLTLSCNRGKSLYFLRHLQLPKS